MQHKDGLAGRPLARDPSRSRAGNIRQGRERLTNIMKNFEDMQKFGKDNADAAMKSLGAVSKSVQAIAVEMADYSKKAFEDGAAATEKLLGAKSIEKAVEVQSDYVKTAYEGFMSQSAKLGQLYSDLAQEAYKPLEGYVSKATLAK
jgi:hypothetical protein